MSSQFKLYYSMKAWLLKTKEGCSPEESKEYRDKVGRLMYDVFGRKVSDQVKSPTAMGYDEVRNELVKGDPESLKLAEEAFSKIKNPEE